MGPDRRRPPAPRRPGRSRTATASSSPSSTAASSSTIPISPSSLWRNAAETPANGVDDDRNGYVDDVYGANIKALNGNVEDDNGHGTHVAGIVAAQAGNGTGGSGIAPGARIMAIKVLDANRAGDSSQLAKGIRYAVDRGAKILNVSINGDGTSPDLDAALKYAGEKGATVVASAGNNSRDLDLTPSYPASSAEPAVLTVTATEPTGSLLSIANRGLRSVDLAAPGGNILSTARARATSCAQGTSMAAPFVSGSLALLAAARPDLSQSALRAALVQSAPRPKLLAGLLGSGALNVAAALHSVLPGDMWRATGRRGRRRRRRRRGDRASRSAPSAASAPAARRPSAGRPPAPTASSAGASCSTASASRRCRARSRSCASASTAPGTHRWKVVGVDAEGAKVVSAARAVQGPAQPLSRRQRVRPPGEYAAAGLGREDMTARAARSAEMAGR